MTVKQIHIKPPFNTLVITVEYNPGTNSVCTIECLNAVNGEWVDANEKEFEDEEVRKIIRSHKHLWTQEIKDLFKEQNYKKLLESVRNDASQNTLCNNEIENILDSLL